MTRGTRAVASVWLLTFVTLMSVQHSRRLKAPPCLSREQLQALVDESGKALRNLIAARDQPPVPALAFKKDKRGKSPAEDLKQYVLPQELQLETGNARRQRGARSQCRRSSRRAVQVVELRQGLKAGIDRYQAITEYWRESASQPYTEGAARKATLKANGIDTPNQAEIETLVRAARSAGRRGRFPRRHAHHMAEAERAAETGPDRGIPAAPVAGR